MVTASQLLVRSLLILRELNVHNRSTETTNQMQQLLKFYYWSFRYSLTCFGHPHAHHQELHQLQQQPLIYLRNVAIAVLLVVVGPTGRPDHDQQHCYHQAPTVKPEAATAVGVAPDDGHEDAQSMLSCI
jgi:hypothetical protein